MRAVNLMPADARSGRGGAGAAGYAGYVVLAALAALLAVAALWGLAAKQVADRQARVDQLAVEAQSAEARASAAAPYEAFSRLAKDRVATVTALSATRFDWATALREVSRVLPADVWLTEINGSSGASSSQLPSPTASAAPAPKFRLDGCTTSQAKVARLMSRLRTIDGVRSVELSRSEKPDGDGGSDCPAASADDPRFTMTIAFRVPGAAKDAVDASGQVVDPSAAPAAAAAPAGAAPATPAPAPASASAIETPSDGAARSR